MVEKKKKSANLSKNSYEYAAWAQGLTICGIDEVGRGCLAGPVVTAAVILAPGSNSRLLKDSKILTEEERLKAGLWIAKNAWCGYGIIHHRLIDKVNIWQATLLAMKKALINLLAHCPYTPQTIVVDAMPLNMADTHVARIPVHHFPFGESKSSSIAAASIMAKIKRDAMMREYGQLFPGYLLEQNKGYGTPQHKDAVIELKHSIIHRASFLTNIDPLVLHEADYEKQQSLC